MLELHDTALALLGDGDPGVAARVARSSVATELERFTRLRMAGRDHLLHGTDRVAVASRRAFTTVAMRSTYWLEEICSARVCGVRRHRVLVGVQPGDRREAVASLSAIGEGGCRQPRANNVGPGGTLARNDAQARTGAAEIRPVEGSLCGGFEKIERALQHTIA